MNAWHFWIIWLYFGQHFRCNVLKTSSRFVSKISSTHTLWSGEHKMFYKYQSVLFQYQPPTQLISYDNTYITKDY